MSFLSVLGKIGKGAFNVATGGVGGTILDALGSGGQAAAQGRQNDTLTQAQLAAYNNRNAIDAATYNRDTQSQLQRRALLARLLQGAQDYTINDPRVTPISGGLTPSSLRQPIGGGGPMPASPYGDMAAAAAAFGGNRQSSGGLGGMMGGLSDQLVSKIGQQAPMAGPGGGTSFMDLLGQYGGGAESALGSGSYQFTPQVATFKKPGFLEQLGNVAGLAGGFLGAIKPRNSNQMPSGWSGGT